MEGNIYIQGSPAPEITIQGGATFFMDSASLLVGTNSSGRLSAQGGTDGITFTSEDNTPGDWDQLHLGAYDQGSTLEGVTAEYGGSTGNGLVYLIDNAPELIDCTVRASASEGVFVSTGAAPAISGTTVSDNAELGVYVASDAGLSTTNAPSFTDNVLTGNGDAPMSLPAASVDQLDASASFAGNGEDRVVVTADTVDQDSTWQALDVAYRMEGNIFIQGSSNPHVTVEPGATLLFGTGAYLLIAYSDYGSLSAVGTETAPILFSSAASAPAAGDWGGLYFGTRCIDTASELDHVTVGYAGSSLGNVELDSCDMSISNSTIEWSASWGIYRGTASPQLTDITYRNNNTGDLY